MGALDDRIAEVEQRLMAREARLRQHWNALQRGVHDALKPQRALMPLVGPLLALLAWPLLPRALRRRVSPATAIAVLGMVLPFARLLLPSRGVAQRTGRPVPLATRPVDLPRYMGRWYEIARLPAVFEATCAGQPVAWYAALPVEGGRAPAVRVVNRCLTRTGRMREARGVARVVEHSGGARLKVSFMPPALRWLPGTWADYWILHVAEDYSEALVGEPGRRHLWILSRTPEMAPARLQALVERARGFGFDVTPLRYARPPSS